MMKTGFKPTPWIVFHLLTISLLIAVAYFMPLVLDENLAVEMPSPKIWLNVLPAGLLAVFFLALTRRPLASICCLLFVVAFLHYVNEVKLEVLDEPLVFSDFLLIPQAFTGFNVLGLYVDVKLLVFALLVFLFLLAASLKWDKPVINRLPALVLGGISLYLLVSLSFQDRLLGRLYHSEWFVGVDWLAKANVEQNGLYASLVRTSTRIKFTFSGVDPEDMRRPDFLPAQPARVAPGSELLPDIIVVLSESFFDLAILDGVEDCEFLPAYCTIRSRGQSGWLQVPTYGGITTRTEFELLTGVPVSLFPEFTYPYMSVVNRPFAALPRQLRSLGYDTTAIHTNDATFWRRHVVLPLLGFDEFIAEGDIKDKVRHGYFVADSVLTREVFKVLDEPGSDGPQFVLAISMENHGSWNESRLSVLPQSVADVSVPEAVVDDPQRELQQYLYHAQLIVEELQKLADYVQQRPRKTALLFFGDHLPGLNRSYDMIGFDDGKGAWTQYPPYLLISNFEIDYRMPPQMDVHQLLLQTLFAAGVPLEGEYEELRLTYSHLLGADNDNEKEEAREYLTNLQTVLLQKRVLQTE